MTAVLIMGVVAIGLVAGIAVAPAQDGSRSKAVATDHFREFEGRILSVKRSNHTFRMRNRHGAKVRIKVTRHTLFDELAGFGSLHRGLRVEVEVSGRTRSGAWKAVEVEHESDDD
jgi:hypothetical protein